MNIVLLVESQSFFAYMQLFCAKVGLCQFRNLMTFQFLLDVDIFRTNKLFGD